ncbi:polysaccharide pyruvyl transferase family protein [Thalassotalea fusca]
MLSKVTSKLKAVAANEYRNLFHRANTINIKYYEETLNWGDKINIDIIEYVSKKTASNCPLAHRPHLLGIGSILVTANRNSVIWGSGFLSDRQRVKEKPAKVCSVRGPHSRKMLLDAGIDCPEIYGDPALLLPKLYSPESPVNKKYKLGIVPHYEHKSHPWIVAASQHPDVKIIDIQTDSLEGFIDDLHECEHIASSSLHGVIASDAYGISNCRIVLHKMNSFKFNDYYAGIGIDEFTSLEIQKETEFDIDDIVANCKVKCIKFSADKLLSAFPMQL